MLKPHGPIGFCTLQGLQKDVAQPQLTTTTFFRSPETGLL